MNQGARWVLLMRKKNGGRKSRATVPLKLHVKYYVF